MLYQITLKLTSPFLGEGPLKNEKRSIVKNDKGFIVVDRLYWNWSVKESIQINQLVNEVDPECFLDFLPFAPPTICMYSRGFHRRGKKVFENFESIRKGAVITAGFIVSSTAPPKRSRTNEVELFAPTLPQIKLIMGTVGEYFGISQWGSQHGYGRFQIMDLNTTGR